MPYSGDPAASPGDAVRHLIGDTDPANPFLTDEEIDYELDAAGAVERTAAIACCVRLRARFAFLADTTEGDVSKKWSQLFDHFGDLAAALADPSTSGAAASAVPFAGGTDRAPLFTRGRPGERTVRPSFTDYPRRVAGRTVEY